MNRKELEKKVGPFNESMQKSITDMGTPVDDFNDSEVSVEIFPNRPDLLSIENISYAINQYNGKSKIINFKVNRPEKNYIIKIDKSVKGIRPYTVCAVIKGINFTDEKIKSIIDIQEKLHGSIGRKRKKLAIGVYPLEKINFPITYKADLPDNIKFRPLGSEKIMTAKQILKQHPTGMLYADLLKDKEMYPFFIDSSGEIMSMPPIINSYKTGRITEKTKDIFIECSGNNLYYLNKALNIIVTSLYLMGGKIYGVNVIDKIEKSYITPNLSFEKMLFNISDINKTLGLNLNEKEISRLLSKMGIGFERKKNEVFALIPPYRTDILHWIDLAEEIAIAYGYDNFEPILPKISTIAEEDEEAIYRRKISEILSGLGLIETSSFHLNTKKDIKKIYFNMNDFIELEKSKTEKDALRYDLLTNNLQILSENSDSVYPQKIFEVGKVFEKDENEETKIKEKDKLVVSIISESANFTEIKQILDYLFKMLDKKYEIENNDEHPAYINGRSGIIKVNDKKIGEIGEIAPRVLKNWKIKMPVVAFEIEI
jgi:phenylalanyl-tRNA synthetase beta chain